MVSVAEPVGYREAWALQQRWHAARVAGETPDRLLLLEHRSVYTLGRARGAADHLLEVADAEVVESDRGGDVTWHGPGQLVGYPILHLAGERRDLHRYLRDLEQLLIDTCAALGLAASRRAGLTGIWVGQRKLASLGIRVSRWVTQHGFGFNRAPDLSAFARIVPCGIDGVAMTSLAAEGVDIDRAALERRLLAAWPASLGHQAMIHREVEDLAALAAEAIPAQP